MIFGKNFQDKELRESIEELIKGFKGLAEEYKDEKRKKPFGDTKYMEVIEEDIFSYERLKEILPEDLAFKMREAIVSNMAIGEHNLREFMHSLMKRTVRNGYTTRFVYHGVCPNCGNEYRKEFCVEKDILDSEFMADEGIKNKYSITCCGMETEPVVLANRFIVADARKGIYEFGIRTKSEGRIVHKMVHYIVTGNGNINDIYAGRAIVENEEKCMEMDMVVRSYNCRNSKIYSTNLFVQPEPRDLMEREESKSSALYHQHYEEMSESEHRLRWPVGAVGLERYLLETCLFDRGMRTPDFYRK